MSLINTSHIAVTSKIKNSVLSSAVLFSSLLFTSSVSLAAADKKITCEQNHLIAQFQLTLSNKKKIPLTIYRNETYKQVTYQYEDMAERWTLMKNKKTNVTRFFNKHFQGVEYQADEIGNNSTFLYDQKYSLINPKMLYGYKLIETKGKGCQEVAVYQKGKTTIEWLLAYNIVKSYKTDNQNWVLLNIENNKDQFTQDQNKLDQMNLLDYADVGDNESDPFIAKMINQGFIKHGASGFYDADGRPLGHNH